jgi:hypothetical protein
MRPECAPTLSPVSQRLRAVAGVVHLMDLTGSAACEDSVRYWTEPIIRAAENRSLTIVSQAP